MNVDQQGTDKIKQLATVERVPELSKPGNQIDPGGWSKAAAVGLYFIFPGICTLSLFKKVFFYALFEDLYAMFLDCSPSSIPVIQRSYMLSKSHDIVSSA
ncbi:hypothetical protein STEG23_009660 [Scotinomys teguina]